MKNRYYPVGDLEERVPTGLQTQKLTRTPLVTLKFCMPLLELDASNIKSQLIILITWSLSSEYNLRKRISVLRKHISSSILRSKFSSIIIFSHKFVFKHDFTHECLMLGLEFTEEELSKIFEFICQVGSKGTDSTDQQKQLLEKKTQKSTTRFTFK